MSKVSIEAYVEEKEFKNENGENVKYLTLSLPVTDSTVKYIKCDKLVLELARDRALSKSKNLFK